MMNIQLKFTLTLSEFFFYIKKGLNAKTYNN